MQSQQDSTSINKSRGRVIFALIFWPNMQVHSSHVKALYFCPPITGSSSVLLVSWIMIFERFSRPKKERGSHNLRCSLLYSLKGVPGCLLCRDSSKINFNVFLLLHFNLPGWSELGEKMREDSLNIFELYSREH